VFRAGESSGLARVPGWREFLAGIGPRGPAGNPVAGDRWRDFTCGMEDYEPVMSFGQDTADIYDASQRGDEAAAAAFLERLAGAGPALELAIGTGRIALPLAARGIRVDGIDLSPAMVARLRAKPGGDQISVTMGDFADVPVPGTYRLVFVVFNTLFNLLTQDDQVRCFENVAAHLDEDGSFVVEAFVPSYLYRLRDDQYVDAENIGVTEVWFDAGRHDPVAQRLDETHVRLTREEGVRLYPVVTRYAWPSELDLMAHIAGLRLKERWAGWNGEPFNSASKTHVSVYGR
jgi:cyclopropane fatty-acyl-phospholipid synthase-like methyltransferase